eukprot:Gb_25172 [translate_table: standard]
MGSIWLSYHLPLPTRNHCPTRRHSKVRGRWNVVTAHMPIIPPLPPHHAGIGHANIALIATTYENIGASIGSAVGEAKDFSIVDRWQRFQAAFQEVFEPFPNSPARGGDLTKFLSTSALLVLLFWLGNYVVPDWIFSKTVFRKTDDDGDFFGLLTKWENTTTPSSKNSKPSEVVDSGVEASTPNVNRERKSVGFGKNIKSKRKRSKS